MNLNLRKCVWHHKSPYVKALRAFVWGAFDPPVGTACQPGATYLEALRASVAPIQDAEIGGGSCFPGGAPFGLTQGCTLCALSGRWRFLVILAIAGVFAAANPSEDAIFGHGADEMDRILTPF